ncbi:unnamed protein product, partial [Brenthis ino]
MLKTLGLVIYLNSIYSLKEPNISQLDINAISNIVASKPGNITQINENMTLDFFYGNSNSTADGTNENIDLSFLDMDTQNHILSIAKAKNEETEAYINKTIQRRRNEAYYHVPFFYNKTLDLMKQSIYGTRYKLQETRELRMKYSKDLPYNIAILYGALMQMRIKIDNIYATLMKFPLHYKFLYFLIVYERCVAINMDVTDMVKRIFDIADMYRKALGEGEENSDDEEFGPPKLIG